jgi:hypothetical protein
VLLPWRQIGIQSTRTFKTLYLLNGVSIIENWDCTSSQDGHTELFFWRKPAVRVFFCLFLCFSSFCSFSLCYLVTRTASVYISSIWSLIALPLYRANADGEAGILSYRVIGRKKGERGECGSWNLVWYVISDFAGVLCLFRLIAHLFSLLINAFGCFCACVMCYVGVDSGLDIYRCAILSLSLDNYSALSLSMSLIVPLNVPPPSSLSLAPDTYPRCSVLGTFTC